MVFSILYQGDHSWTQYYSFDLCFRSSMVQLVSRSLNPLVGYFHRLTSFSLGNRTAPQKLNSSSERGPSAHRGAIRVQLKQLFLLTPAVQLSTAQQHGFGGLHHAPKEHLPYPSGASLPGSWRQQQNSLWGSGQFYFPCLQRGASLTRLFQYMDTRQKHTGHGTSRSSHYFPGSGPKSEHRPLLPRRRLFTQRHSQRQLTQAPNDLLALPGCQGETWKTDAANVPAKLPRTASPGERGSDARFTHGDALRENSGRTEHRAAGTPAARLPSFPHGRAPTAPSRPAPGPAWGEEGEGLRGGARRSPHAEVAGAHAGARPRVGRGSEQPCRALPHIPCPPLPASPRPPS